MLDTRYTSCCASCLQSAVFAAAVSIRRFAKRRSPRRGARTSGSIVHVSLQRNHVHMLVEARNKDALAVGMQGFQISAAKHLNAAISKGRPGPRRRGTVFSDRYHAEIITSPRQARHALSYVVNNWRKHREDRVFPMSTWKIDWFSSAIMFPGWDEYGDAPFLWRWPAGYDPLVVYQPRTWLLRECWRKHGAVSCSAVPSAER